MRPSYEGARHALDIAQGGEEISAAIRDAAEAFVRERMDVPPDPDDPDDA